MDIDTKTLQLLMEAGLLAGAYGYFKESAVILEGVRAVRPESEYPYIGMAVTQMNTGKAGDAVDLLRDHALMIRPESDMAKSFLGLALKLDGRAAESEALLKEIAENGIETPAVRMAQALLAQEG